VRRGLGVLARLLWSVGIRGDYSATFWRIELALDGLRGTGESSFYTIIVAAPVTPEAVTA